MFHQSSCTKTNFLYDVGDRSKQDEYCKNIHDLAFCILPKYLIYTKILATTSYLLHADFSRYLSTYLSAHVFVALQTEGTRPTCWLRPSNVRKYLLLFTSRHNLERKSSILAEYLISSFFFRFATTFKPWQPFYTSCLVFGSALRMFSLFPTIPHAREKQCPQQLFVRILP